MESVFTFLFKYRPLLFEQGTLVVQPPVPAVLLAVVVAGALVLIAWTYRRPLAKARPADRAALLGIRVLAAAVLFLCLLRPTLVISSVVPQQNYLAVVVDDSRSMRIADEEGRTRADAVAGNLGGADAALVRALEERFQVRYFRFSSELERIASVSDLTYDGGRTSLAPALRRVQEELGSLPLSGIVLVTDGADGLEAGQPNGPASPLGDALLSLRAAGVPVFPVGVGQQSFDRDIELSRVAAPREALQGTSLVVDLVVTQTGFNGRSVTVLVEDDGRIVGSEEITLPRSAEPTPVRVHFQADDAGIRRFRFRIPVQDGERVVENNAQEALIDVKSGREKILYFEGEPRYEVAFLRRAVARDSSLQLVVLQRTADGRYMRLDVDSAGELYSGFPTTREELFAYRGLVLGSVEASHFTYEQLRMMADFVSERGGGLLMLGGRRSFAEGGYAGTPLADVLPVGLDARFSRDTMFFDTLQVRLTAAGARQPALRVAADDAASADRWRTLPAPTTYNRVGPLKPGAVALLSGSGRRSAEDTPVLAWQRYGRGQAFALPVQDTWIWQMHADVPLEDETHQVFWRQLLRWLVSGVPERVVPSVVAEHVYPGAPVSVSVDVSDERFMKLNNARVSARVVGPDGGESELALDWTVARDGEYRGTFTANGAGLYEVHVTAAHDEGVVAARPMFVVADDSRDEFVGAQMREPLLRRIAAETGGRFYTTANMASLPADLVYAGRGITLQEEKDLWDAPILFLLLVALLAGEWAYRRARGLA
ncbi:MAG TPA: hypothetical protein VK929_10735 [Longimicrobiales bacterium]|nr:hypothetical protein [Longimicrobiales bacterium]